MTVPGPSPYDSDLPITLASWRTFCADQPPAPLLADHLLTGKDVRWDDPRLRYHGPLVMVKTPAIQDIIRLVQQQLRSNMGRRGSRYGLVLDGPSATGKTTMLQQAGRTHERMLRRIYPDDTDSIPVIYISVPSQVAKGRGASTIAEALCFFLGLPPTGDLAEIKTRLYHVMSKARTQLVLIDEIHNLRGAADINQISDYIKDFAELLPVTFVHAGLDAWKIITSGSRGAQAAKRYCCYRTQPFNRGTTEEKSAWLQVVATFDNALRLHNHQPEDLLPLAPYLHQRTKGYIGTLSQLISQAAQEAITNSTEKITEDLLGTILLDGQAENLDYGDEDCPDKAA
ncbi:TniB family NTP-binding protein [Kitasatospora purpeofusca]|uniref:TniB family NTP-binding protein n=1 Tax=Kitasatospora purpeofusca TaxID=67352 RepID=UPI00386498A5|nr:ATP-binding protein [Kitasatospora purpeofusca]